MSRMSDFGGGGGGGGVTSLNTLTGAITLAAGTGISLTPTGNTLTITATGAGGIVSVTGTADQVTASTTLGAVTLSTPSTFTSPGSITATTNFVLPTTTATAGQILWNSVPWIHGYTGATADPLYQCMFLGGSAGNFTHTGEACYTLGVEALKSLTSGIFNIALGLRGLAACTTGSQNTAVGAVSCCQSFTTGSYNTAIGAGSLYGLLGTALNGDGNTAIGLSAPSEGSGRAHTSTDSWNVDIAFNGVSGESNKLHIGKTYDAGDGTGINAAYIAGITGVTVTGTAVLVATDNQLGVASSSAKYKKDITDMPDMSQVIDKLRPVTFHYKDEKQSAQLNYGLIAEEVEPVWPEMVAYDKDGQISTLYYQFLAPILLKEVQLLRKENKNLSDRIAALEKING